MPCSAEENIIVAGTPGAWVNIIAGLMQKRGWAVTWPDQDVDVYDGEVFRDHNKQNIEVHNIHRIMCWQQGVSLTSVNLPTFYDVPYPGPREFLAKFDKPVVISGTCLSPFLDLWVESANVVIDIQATEAEDLKTLRSWTDGSFTEKHLQDVRDHQLSRYAQHLRLFPRVFTMTNSEVRDERFDGLLSFLNSTF